VTCITQTKSSHNYFQQTPPNLDLPLPELLQLPSSSSPWPPLRPPDLTWPPLCASSPRERRSLLLSDIRCFSCRRHTPILWLHLTMATARCLAPPHTDTRPRASSHHSRWRTPPPPGCLSRTKAGTNEWTITMVPHVATGMHSRTDTQPRALARRRCDSHLVSAATSTNESQDEALGSLSCCR
jgi:hypothetical protein